MRSFFSKFKFKWWSWELDSVKLVPALLILLACLPVLPYERKEGKLVSVLGMEASVDNFYFIGFGNLLDEEFKEEDSDWTEGGSLNDLVKLSEEPIPNTQKQKEHLMNQGSSEEFAKCIIMRDLFIYSYFFDKEVRYLLNKYPPSPVPIVWIARSAMKEVLDYTYTPYVRYKDFNKLIEICSEFQNIAPPKGYLEGDFRYKKCR